MVRTPKENPRLYEAVLADPDNDAPRLAYADWFAKNGQRSRGRFIRLQCQLARLLVGDPQTSVLEDEANQLYHRYGEGWVGNHSASEDIVWYFQRGFPEHVVFPSFTTLQKHQAEVLRHPIRRLGFSKLRSLARLASWPGLARIRELDLEMCGVSSLDGLEALIDSPHIGQLTSLALAGDTIGAAGARLLAGWPRLTGVQELRLHGGRIGDDGLEALVDSRYLSALTSLELAGNGIGPDGFRLMANAGCWPGLVSLGLGTNRAGDDGAKGLAGARQWTALGLLDLSRNRIGDQGIAELARAGWLDRVAVLRLSTNAIGDAGALALAGSTHLGRLHTLLLGGNLIGNEGAYALARSPHLGAVRHVHLVLNAIDPLMQAAVEIRFRAQDFSLLDALGEPEESAATVELPAPPPLLKGESPSDEEALLQAILDDPDDDVARLVYADWLEENGQAERAEIVRLQCDPTTERFNPREKELTQRIVADYPHAMKKHTQVCWFDQGLLQVWVLMRTFVSRAFQEQAPIWMRAAGVHSLTLRGRTRCWQKVADSPVLDCIHELLLRNNNLDTAAVEALTGSTRLAGLHALFFCHNDLRESLAVLLRSASLPRLRRLRLQEARIDLEGLRALAGWPQISRLTTLDLSINRLRAAEVSLLCNCPNLTGLVHLDLGNNYLSDAGCRVLAGSPHLSGLHRLRLNMNFISDEGVRSLAGSPYLRQLQVLDLWGNSIGDEGVRALLESPLVDGLRLLSLTQRRLSTECIELLKGRLGNRVRLSNW